jgi:endonuclease/exonuclease/phosphatase family metal-dependent hydrolase
VSFSEPEDAMRLAVYNVENLFDRARVMNLEDWAAGKPVLDRFSELNTLLGKAVYGAADKSRMSVLLTELGLAKQDQGPFVLLRRNRGGLLTRPRAGPLTITADGRADWVGSLELRDEPVNHAAVLNTARVIHDVGADVLAVVEAESRPALAEFNRIMMPAVGGTPYRHVMVIDGNDPRGIDVGLMTGRDYRIGRMRSHVDDRDDGDRLIFSRDCPQFEVATPEGQIITVLVNHLKSKGYGKPAESSARRQLQAARVADIYRELVAAGQAHVAVVGDLNDTPDSAALQPLLAATDLRDISGLPGHDDGGYAGTYGASAPGNKIDYILLSPALQARVTASGVFRKGMWPGARAKRWPAYPTIRKPMEAASDHAALWVDLDL